MSTSHNRKRLALDLIGQLEEEVEINPLDNVSWTKLIKQVLAKDKEEQVRSVFEKYLSIFKFDGAQWYNYINYELNRGEFQKVQQLFPRCLTTTPNVELCRLYVSYVRRVNDVITGGEKARGIVIQAFEFAVARVGIDINSSDLWLDYIEFLKFWTPAASWEQQQKVDLIRKVYKRCLSIPTEKIETMWSTYTKWENDINTATASKFIAEKSTSFMEARSWNTEWHNITQSLKREIIPFGITNDKDSMVSNQMKLWFNWIELEKENKLNLKEAASVRQRIEYVYKQSISALPFVPEIWFRFNKFLLSNNEEANLSNCIEQTEEALKLNDHSFLLSFQLSELYEKDNSFNQASTTLNNLIDVYIKDDNLVVEKIEKILEEKKINQVSNGDNEDMQESTFNGEKDNDDDDDEEESVKNSQAQKILNRFTEEESDHLIELQEKHEELSKLITLIYTKLMIMSKRAEGMKESRTVFKQARKNYKSLGYQLFTEHALMEYYADRQKNADNIFKLAMKNYSTNGEFLLSYLNYLVLTNAVESIKVFFESAVTNLLKEITQEKESLNNTLDLYQTKSKTKNIEQNQYYMKKIIKKYVRFASNYLDIDTVKSLENRYEQFFPDDDPLELFADRYKSDSFDVISKYDLGKQVTSENVDPDLNRDSKRRKIESSSDNYTPEAESLPVHDEISQKPAVEVNQHGFVGNTVYNLLQILPNAGYFGPPPEHVFNTGKLVELFSNLPDIPDNL